MELQIWLSKQRTIVLVDRRYIHEGHLSFSSVIPFSDIQIVNMTLHAYLRVIKVELAFSVRIQLYEEVLLT
jgi:ABC-type polysaccharide/polyol phosphate transport system ATPase subunit